jgi:hypothetical protein
MSPLWRKLFCLASAVLCSLSLQAQSTTNITAIAPVKSPVTIFREMLAMSPEDRRATISIYPPENQKRIIEKLDEYQMLPDELRERRLRETELRWYLRPLMDEPRTNRTARLALIPEEERSLVEERLQMWDVLPPDLKQQWTNDDMVADYFAQIQSDPDHRDVILSNAPVDRRAELEKGLEHWEQMSGGERQKALLGFNKFFELPPEEEEKTLDTVSDEERQQMQQTLDAYKNLSPQQRAQCIRSFEKFANMSVAERNQFLKNVERWNEMTPEERQKWRDLVTVAPILPPPDASPRKLPSHSERLVPRTAPTRVATN